MSENSVSRRDALKTLAATIFGVSAGIPLFSKSTNAQTNQKTGLVGFSKIYNTENHGAGVFGEHGKYGARIRSSYNLTGGLEDTTRVLNLMKRAPHRAIGNAGWFEDYQTDRPSALYFEEGKRQQDFQPGTGGEGVILCTAEGIKIKHIENYKQDSHYSFPKTSSTIDSAVQAVLLQYEGNSVNNVPENKQDIIARTGLAVGKKGMFYFVLKNVSQDTLVTELNKLYSEHVDPNENKLTIAQLDSGPSSQVIIDPSIALNPSYTKNIEHKFIGSARGVETVNGKRIDYTKKDEEESKVANFFVFN